MSLITGENQLKASGGWMIGLANEIAKHPEIELSVATLYHKVKSLKVSKGENPGRRGPGLDNRGKGCPGLRGRGLELRVLQAVYR